MKNHIEFAKAMRMERYGYRRCTRCVMDTTDREIRFDANGICHHCHHFEKRLKKVNNIRSQPEKYLHPLVLQIQKEGRGKPYDCILGISGGIDSTYSAYTAKKLGLRPLAVHLDNGWDSIIAVENIQNCLEILDIDLYTEVLDWEAFRDLQVAFLKASTPDSEIPTDHAIGAVLLRQAIKWEVRYIIAGQNVDTEGMGVKAWLTGYHDWRYIKSVYSQFGSLSLKNFPHYSFLEHALWKLIRGIRRIDILNYVPYRRADAKGLLESELGWKDYGGKHYESIYCKFFQSYILTKKFGYDKRLFHLSPLIITGSLSREEALDILSRPPYDSVELKSDMEYVLKKLNLTREQFEKIMALPKKTIYAYPSYERSLLYKIGLFLYKRISGTDDSY